MKAAERGGGARIRACGAVLFIIAASLLCGEIIDRIAISVGNQVITESQISDEVRLTQFLNREKLDVSTAEKQKAAGRLIEQALVRRDMELSHYPLPPLEDAAEVLKNLKTGYHSEADYRSALQEYGITEDALLRRLWWQLTIVRFIDYRFRPGVQISDAEIQAYYQQQLANWQQQGARQIPTLQDSRDNIEQILTEKHIDEALDAWLAETRKQVEIKYRDESLQS